MKKRGLGRNIEILLKHGLSQELDVSASNDSSQLRHLPVEQLQRGRYQPRREIPQESLQELSESIRQQGILQPLVVRNLAGDQYEIIAGERRWRAAQLAGLTQVPVIIKDISDETALAVALIENIQREDLNPLDEALALQRLADEFTLTHQQVADLVGKSRVTVSNLLRLLSLQPEVKALLAKGQLEMGHARALLSLSAHPQIQLANAIVAQGLSVRQVEQLVRKQITAQPITTNERKPELDPNIKSLQRSLSEQLGVKIDLQHHNKGHGKLIIHYNSLDELEGVLEHIK